MWAHLFERGDGGSERHVRVNVAILHPEHVGRVLETAIEVRERPEVGIDHLEVPAAQQVTILHAVTDGAARMGSCGRVET